MKPNVSIIILNWNGWDDTVECLESLYQIDYPNYNIIIVDNASKDDSLKKIKEYCQGKIDVKSDFFEYKKKNKPIEIIEITKENSEKLNFNDNDFSNLNSDKLIIIKNDKNHGFAEGNNIGIKFALKQLNPHYILLLNNDVVVSSDFMKHLVSTSQKEKDVGIVGPTILFYNEKSRIQSAGVKINWHKGIATSLNRNKPYDFHVKQIIDVDSLSGCCLLVRSELFQQIGLFNSDYFLYWEETEFCVRSKKVDYRIIYDSQSKIWHKSGESTKKSRGCYEYFYVRNMVWFMKSQAKKEDFYYFTIYLFGYHFWYLCGLFIFTKRDPRSLFYSTKGLIHGFLKSNS